MDFPSPPASVLLVLLAASAATGQCLVCIQDSAEPGNGTPTHCPWVLEELPSVLFTNNISPPDVGTHPDRGSLDVTMNGPAASGQADAFAGRGTLLQSDSDADDIHLLWRDTVGACTCNSWSTTLVVSWRIRASMLCGQPNGTGNAVVTVNNQWNDGHELDLVAMSSYTMNPTTGTLATWGFNLGISGSSLGFAIGMNGGGGTYTTSPAPVNHHRVFVDHSAKAGGSTQVIGAGDASMQYSVRAGNRHGTKFTAVIEDYLAHLGFIGACGVCGTVQSAAAEVEPS